ncbi:serine/threonine-protein kinase ATG1a isoform X2 [Beta vulgaris subsp. vulgaris]|uniref:serine/threonine-protein kinase ATG1a isoform X2 n=1 Tax=Beta vulgaris subsp. vulgaris TaxID=3555 RepID=UPI0020371EE2|nr:serine/threonine-protein kinase ATG1a isoform X2 [Beta vulgaris subsp. vulgaris]
MDFDVGTSRCRIVGDYIIGPKIGSGSFAVVWKSKHRVLGTEFAIKEIDKKHFNENLRKEISILRNITHPNIIRLFEAIETEERIFLVLEYCEGGDLGAYIHRHGRVSEDVARHFIKQLAAGLQVLRENNLIHRDLKPQNLLLSGREVTPLLKIGDFGFARYLTPQGLADTLCGSPLYMAPEIIQNQKYDARADLWSVGAICYQLVVGKPPFDGNSQLQLFQNVLRAKELQFPEGSLQVLHPDYVEFCRSLLRRNPVERLTFGEFFNHKFLMVPRVGVKADSSSQISQVEPLVRGDDQGPRLHHEDVVKAPEESVKRGCSLNDENREFGKDHCSTSRGKDVSEVVPDISTDKIRHSVEDGSHSLGQTRGEYVLVHSNFASMEILTSSLGISLKEGSAIKASDFGPKNNDKHLPTMPEMNELTSKLVGGSDNSLQSEMNLLTTSGAPCLLGEAQELPILHPSTRLQLIHQYVGALSDLAREKFNAEFFLESFSVELVVLALWKKALRICNSWMLQSGLSDSSSGKKSAGEGAASSSSKTEDTTDFMNPSSVSIWAEQGFIDAYDGTEKLSKYLQDVDGGEEMPDAMEIIFQTAIAAGKDGAADEFVGNRDSAAVMYTRALLLFSFIVTEAPSLPLNPPFSLAPDCNQRVLKYIKSLEYHLSHSRVSGVGIK